MWIPVHRSWRLNEAALRRPARPQQVGDRGQVWEAQVKSLRRSYDIPRRP